MKTLKHLLLTALLCASFIGFVSCNPPAQPVKSNLANKIYQTNWNKSSALKLEFSSDGSSAKFFNVHDYHAEELIESNWEGYKQAILSNNPNATFDDTKYYCFEEQDFSPISLEKLLEVGSFSADYSTYTILETATNPAYIFHRQ